MEIDSIVADTVFISRQICFCILVTLAILLNNFLGIPQTLVWFHYAMTHS